MCDDLSNFDTLQFPFKILEVRQFGIPKFNEMRHRYNITELNTSIKPFVFSYLFDVYPDEMITYLDPDIFVVSPFQELLQASTDGADCVLTPHILEPAEFAEMDDKKFLQYGIHNLGFCALRGTAHVKRIVSWWGRRLEADCVIDLPNGLFVDQKWADLLPSFISNTKILRHRGYNVAYWNLSQRVVRLDGDQWNVNGEPLRFFHFSGNKIEDVSVLSRHSSQFTVENAGDVGKLLDIYRSSVFKNGHSYYATIPYGFNWSGAAGYNAHTQESIAIERQSRSRQIPHLPLLKSTSLADFNLSRSYRHDVEAGRQRVEIEAIPFGQDAYTLTGFCACCGKREDFQVSGMYSSRTLEDGRIYPNWREHLNCLSCGLVNRVRASLQVLQQEFAPNVDDVIYVTEQLTPTYRWLKQRFPKTVGSEFLLGEHRSGDIVGEILHQDVQCMSFEESSFQYILTFDVLEHVPDHNRALKEFYRCLAPGGRLMITVPFHWDSQEYQIRAELKESGEIVHYEEPEYHGNPVDMDLGSLCFRYFGWQLLDELREIGFVNCEVYTYWSEELRYFGNPQLIIVAGKATPLP